MLDLETLLRIPDIDTAGGFDLSPDGQRLAFAWNKTGQWEIYELDLRNVGQIANLSAAKLPITDPPITSLSTGPGGKFSPRYSPDGNFLAWALDLDGSESFHILLHDLASGETRDLTPDINFTIQPTFAWSPDGKQIAYLADKTGNFDLYLLNVDSPLPARAPQGCFAKGSAVRGGRFFFSPGGPAHTVRWSLDGRHLAVTAEKEWQADGTFIVPLDGSEVRRVGGLENPIDADQPAWSPDGTKLAFTSNSSGWTQIGVYSLEDDRLEWITAGEGDKLSPAWSLDGKRLAWVHNRGETAWLDLRSENGSLQRIQTEAGFAARPQFSADSQSVFFLYENPRQPPDLWLAALDDGRLTQLTNSLPAGLRTTEFVVPESIFYPSLDGTPIPAMLYKPKDAGPHSPGVVLIHGGPAFHLAYFWHPFIAHLASRGWTVIAPNYRGSTGYGRGWVVSNRYEMGRLDNDDCAAAAIYLAQAGLADPAKIAVTGRSHGGYLTMTCLTRQPELWAGGSAVVPFLNWFTGHENSREDLQYWDILNMGDPVEFHDLWHARSPYFFLDQVRAPVQLICGENDPRCPPSESTDAHEKLQSLGIHSELLLYKGEGHGFLKLENVIDSEIKRVEFLAKVLEKRSLS
jgi:dipeptidyl aminopeptidase/acylaminoacyl peptidase